MSKAFLLLALALVIAYASAANYYVAVATFTDADEACKDLGYWANGNFIFSTTATKAEWRETNDACAAVIGATTDALILAQIEAAQPTACWEATEPGAATWCGVATEGACTATKVCATDNQCVSAVCAARWNYVVTLAATVDAADKIEAAVQAVLDALVDTDDAKQCDGAKTKFTVVSSEVTKNWALVSFETLPAACVAILPTATFKAKVQGETCKTCAEWFNFVDRVNCPCIFPEYTIVSAKYTLVEGKKQSDLEKLFPTTECIKAKQFVSAGNTAAGLVQVVVTLVAKYDNEDCNKEGTDRAADEKWKAVVSGNGVAPFDGEVITAKAEDCSSGDKITKCATDAACAWIPCAKGTACTAENQATLCASLKCDVKEGETAGKCNSASVVGYVVAVVAVVAAFVF